MIQANELRIGNYIASGESFSDTSTIGKVLEVGNEERDFEQVYCECDESFEWFFKNNYCGIPLTEEMLLKCGFIHCFRDHKGEEYFNLMLDGEHQINININTGRFAINKHSIGNGLSVELKYLHQLQNLYFAIKGKELEIQL